MSEIIQVNNHSLPVEQFHAGLRAWDASHRRSFPWRIAKDPFHLMMAELMLRRTQARQVVNVYKAFVERYPDPSALTTASPEEVCRFPLFAWPCLACACIPTDSSNIGGKLQWKSTIQLR